MSIAELMPAHARGDATFVRGRGARLWDDQDREYLDAVAGIAVCGLGHAHPAVTRAICQQAETLTHASNLFHSRPQQKLAKTLCSLSGMDNVFFGNSGAEANEAAACLTKGRAVQVIQPGNHGSTFGGNPLACHAAQAVLDTLLQERLMDRASELGRHILEGLRSRLARQPLVSEVRGHGLMIGIEMKKPCGELVQAALRQGLVINVTAGNVVRLLPPLILSAAEADTLVETLAGVIGDLN
jgi:acetylornithine/succinyldiaminopimelate/putrescine aminotransferase